MKKFLLLIIIATIGTCYILSLRKYPISFDSKYRWTGNIPEKRLETIMLADSTVNWGYAAIMNVETGQTQMYEKIRNPLEEKHANDFGIMTDSLLEVGSIFRTATLLSLLDGGDAKLNSTFDYNEIEGWDIPNIWIDNDYNFIKYSLKEAFIYNSNLAIVLSGYDAYFKEGANREKFYNAIANMGFIVEDTVQDSLAAMQSIGYGVVAKPIQTLQLFSAIANGGKLLDIILTVRYYHEDLTKVINHQIASKRAIKKMQKLLAERGAKYGLDNVAFTSGTTASRNEKGEQVNYVTVAGYLPADNPRYAVIVCIDGDNRENCYAINIFAELIRELKASNYLLHYTIFDPFYYY